MLYCAVQRDLTRELVTVLGLYKEHLRYDRDNFITVYRDNGIVAHQALLDALPQDQISVSTQYDISSLMQLPSTVRGFL